MSTPPSDQSVIVTRLRASGSVFAEDEARLLISDASTSAALAAMVDQRVAGRPLEHVLGWAEFCGLRIAVDPGVFVPRRRTEFLALEAAALIAPGDVVVDLCCGSGAVGAAVAALCDHVDLHAADVDPIAVRCARHNLGGHHVYQGDLFEPLPARLRDRVDVLIANTPYVPTDEIRLMPPEARLHEPMVALDGGADGLDIGRRVCSAARRWLAPGGHLLIETSERQASQLAEIVALGGLTPRVVSAENLDSTIIIGTVPHHSDAAYLRT